MDAYDHGFVHISELLREAHLHPHDDRDFRRGYTHGYHNALDDLIAALRGGTSVEALRKGVAAMERFCDGPLATWRERGDVTSFNPPPSFLAWVEPAQFKAVEDTR